MWRNNECNFKSEHSNEEKCQIKLAVKGMFYEYIAALFKSQNVGSVCK